MSLIKNIAAGIAVASIALAAPALAGASRDVRASSPVKKGEKLVAGASTPLLIIGGLAAATLTVAVVAGGDDDGAPASP